MQPKYLKAASIFVIVFCILLLITSLGFFIFNFSDHPISDKIEYWAQFGDYFGGVLNPILALVNICVFVMLTITIQNLTDRNNKESLETSKRIALMTMKHEELRNLKASMDSVLGEWSANRESFDHIQTVLYTYNKLEYRITFLFPELENSSENALLRKYIVKALYHYQEGDHKAAAGCLIPVQNTYSMLVSAMSRWTVN
jgi:uncharacterized membrane protein